MALLKVELQGEIDRSTRLSDLLAAPPAALPRVSLHLLDDTELDQEMGSRLSTLNEAIDFRPWLERLPAQNSFKGRILCWVQQKLFRLFAPLFDRQVLFAEQLVVFHLASFLRLRRIETRLDTLERELLEQGSLPPRNDDSPPPSP